MIVLKLYFIARLSFMIYDYRLWLIFYLSFCFVEVRVVNLSSFKNQA